MDHASCAFFCPIVELLTVTFGILDIKMPIADIATSEHKDMEPQSWMEQTSVKMSEKAATARVHTSASLVLMTLLCASCPEKPSAVTKFILHGDGGKKLGGRGLRCASERDAQCPLRKEWQVDHSCCLYKALVSGSHRSPPLALEQPAPVFS